MQTEEYEGGSIRNAATRVMINHPRGCVSNLEKDFDVESCEGLMVSNHVSLLNSTSITMSTLELVKEFGKPNSLTESNLEKGFDVEFY